MVVAASWMAICGDERLCTLAWPRSLERSMLSLALRSAADAVSGIGGGAVVVTAGSVIVARADRGGRLSKAEVQSCVEANLYHVTARHRAMRR